jgi:hypothetical protein
MVSVRSKTSVVPATYIKIALGQIVVDVVHAKLRSFGFPLQELVSNSQLRLVTDAYVSDSPRAGRREAGPRRESKRRGQCDVPHSATRRGRESLFSSNRSWTHSLDVASALSPLAERNIWAYSPVKISRFISIGLLVGRKRSSAT